MNPIEVIFGAIERGLGGILAGIYAVIPSYGIAIILLTLLIRFVLYPITAKSTRSMRKMQLLQPHVKELQRRYKDDRQGLSEAQMKLFKENKVSPLSGCLPLLIQMPFLFAMFRVINGGSVGDEKQVGEVGTGFLPEGSQLANDLTGATLENPQALNFLGINLGISPREAFENLDVVGLWGLVGQVIIVALIVVTGFYQQRQLQKRRDDDTKKGVEQKAAPQAMQTVGKVMPVMFGVFSLIWPAGLNLYWLTSNAFQVGQQVLILRKDADWEPVLPKTEKKGKKGSKSVQSGKSAKSAATSSKKQIPQKSNKKTKSAKAPPPGFDDDTTKTSSKDGKSRKAVPKKVAPKSKTAQARANQNKSTNAKSDKSAKNKTKE